MTAIRDDAGQFAHADDDGLVSSADVCERTGITYRQLDYWCRIGILQPAVPAGGSGTHRRFTEREVEVTAALAAVLALDFVGRPGKQVSGLTTLVEHVRSNGATGLFELGRGIYMDLDEFIDSPLPPRPRGGG